MGQAKPGRTWRGSLSVADRSRPPAPWWEVSGHVVLTRPAEGCLAAPGYTQNRLHSIAYCGLSVVLTKGISIPSKSPDHRESGASDVRPLALCDVLLRIVTDCHLQKCSS
jgi:hypothetical protein